MQNIKKMSVLILSVLIGNSLNAMTRDNLKTAESYRERLDEYVSMLRARFEHSRNRFPDISEAFNHFETCTILGKINFIAQLIVRREILASDEVKEYIEREKELLREKVSGLKNKYSDLEVVLYYLELSYWYGTNRLKRFALNLFLEENFKGIRPIGPRDDADLADGLAPAPQDLDI